MTELSQSHLSRSRQRRVVAYKFAQIDGPRLFFCSKIKNYGRRSYLCIKKRYGETANNFGGLDSSHEKMKIPHKYASLGLHIIQ